MLVRDRLIPALVVGLAILLAPIASAAVHQVNVQNFTFSPKDITVQVGDTVEWVFVSGSHTVTSGVDTSDPNKGQVFDEILDSGNTLFQWVIPNTPGLQPYYCTPHWFFGMTGTITIEASVPSFNRFDVIVRDFEFDPRIVEGAAPGDTVCWIWESGLHTTTSGASSNPGHSPGDLWNAVVSGSEPLFCYVIPDTQGVLPYFCSPHEQQGMTGSILVGTSSTGVPHDPQRPGIVAFEPPFPNPSAGTTNMLLTLEQSAMVKMEIFDITGRKVRTLANEQRGAGYHVFRWDGETDSGGSTSSGVYFARVQAGDDIQTHKVFRAHASGHGHH